MTTSLIKKIASNRVLDEAYEWLFKRRKDYSADNDVWFLRRDWDMVKSEIRDQLLTGSYCFSPVECIRGHENTVYLWSAGDSLVLKAMAIVLGEWLYPQLSGSCRHLPGNGGAKGSRINKFTF